MGSRYGLAQGLALLDHLVGLAQGLALLDHLVGLAQGLALLDHLVGLAQSFDTPTRTSWATQDDARPV